MKALTGRYELFIRYLLVTTLTVPLGLSRFEAVVERSWLKSVGLSLTAL